MKKPIRNRMALSAGNILCSALGKLYFGTPETIQVYQNYLPHSGEK